MIKSRTFGMEWVWAKAIMGHLWIKAVSFINKNTWAGTETGEDGPNPGVYYSLWCGRNNDKGSVLAKFTFSVQRNHQRMGPSPGFCTSFSVGHWRGHFYSLAPSQKLEYVAMRRKFTGAQCLQSSLWWPWPVFTSICSASQGSLFVSLLSTQLVLVDSGCNSLLLCLWVSDCSFFFFPFEAQHIIELIAPEGRVFKVNMNRG